MSNLAQAPAADTMTLTEFARLTASAAAEVHNKIMADRKKLGFSPFRSPTSLLPQLVELGVVTVTDADRLANLIGAVLDETAPLDLARIESLKTAITGDAAANPVAAAIAGVVADSASAAAASPHRSVAGADAWGAVFGGVGGAIAGAMVTKSPAGAVAGGCFGAVLVGALASAHEAHYI